MSSVVRNVRIFMRCALRAFAPRFKIRPKIKGIASFPIESSKRKKKRKMLLHKISLFLTLCAFAGLSLAQRRPIKFPGQANKKVTLVQNNAPAVTGDVPIDETRVKLKPGQFLKDLPVRKGPDGRPLLFAPDIKKCQNRTSHGKLGDHHYFLSWRDPWHKFEDWDWFNGRNYCRERCMDLVSFETPLEFQMFVEVMQQDNISSIYTSGRKCNFKGKGCESKMFQPINVNGWFWAGAGNARLPPTNKPSGLTFWSSTGEGGKPQPDNFEGVQAGKLKNVKDDSGLTLEGLQEWHDEACLAVLNNKYNDGIKWHDVACHMRSVIVCEDSKDLLARALRENPGQRIPEPIPIKQ